jgi:hypothetical protein
LRGAKMREICVADDRLAPNFEPCRRLVCQEPQGHAAQRARIVRNLITLAAVAARDA